DVEAVRRLLVTRNKDFLSIRGKCAHSSVDLELSHGPNLLRIPNSAGPTDLLGQDLLAAGKVGDEMDIFIFFAAVEVRPSGPDFLTGFDIPHLPFQPTVGSRSSCKGDDDIFAIWGKRRARNIELVNLPIFPTPALLPIVFRFLVYHFRFFGGGRLTL